MIVDGNSEFEHTGLIINPNDEIAKCRAELWTDSTASTESYTRDSPIVCYKCSFYNPYLSDDVYKMRIRMPVHNSRVIDFCVVVSSKSVIHFL